MLDNDQAASARSLRAAMEQIDSWYHVIDLGYGVRTPGAFDMAKYWDQYPWPDSFEGLRVLDVGASNGYFSIEFAKRGAREVIALDLPGWEQHDWSPKQRRILEARPAEERTSTDETIFGGALGLAIRATGVEDVVKPTACPIYDISPERLGTFDLVFSGSMLMHVRDPLLGMHAIRSATKPGGRFIVSSSTVREIEEHALPLAAFVGEWDQSNFWQLNAACLKRMLATADFIPDDDYVLYDQHADIAEFVDRICVRAGTAP